MPDKEEITEHRIMELIAGPERERSLHDQTFAERLSPTQILRVEQGRIWHDAGTLNFALYPGEIVGSPDLTDRARPISSAASPVFRSWSGRITLLEGKVAHELSTLTSARTLDISYVSGDRKKEGIFPNLSIFENVLLPVYREYRLAGVLNLINRSKLQPVFDWESGKLAVKMGSEDDLITSLSGGNQQKVLIARSFAEKPEVLVLNDPARGIDVSAKLDLYRNLRSSRRAEKRWSSSRARSRSSSISAPACWCFAMAWSPPSSIHPSMGMCCSMRCSADARRPPCPARQAVNRTGPRLRHRARPALSKTAGRCQGRSAHLPRRPLPSPSRVSSSCSARTCRRARSSPNVTRKIAGSHQGSCGPACRKVL